MFRAFRTLLLIPAVACAAQSPRPAWETYRDRAERLQRAGQLDEAAAALSAALREVEALDGNSPDTASVLLRVGQLRTLQRDYAGAREVFERSLRIKARVAGPDSLEAGLILVNIAMIDHKNLDFVRAEREYVQSLETIQKAAGPGSLHAAIVQLGFARLFLARRRNTEAERLLEAAIPTLDAAERPDSILAIALSNLADVYRREGRYSRAEPLYRRALAIVAKQPSTNADEVSDSLLRFPGMLRKMKRTGEAREIETQIKTLLAPGR